MPKRDSAIIGAPCWVDLYTTDTKRSEAFYGELFGWTAESAGPDLGGYINFSKDGVKVAGCMHNDGASGVPNVWSVYLAVADAKATIDATVAQGAAVVVPAMDVLDLGTMAVLTDIGGATIGLWQPGLHQGFGVLAEPGTPAWFELYSRDYAAAVKFYSSVFGLEPHVEGDSDEFRYSTLHLGGEAVAGVMDASGFLPEGVPAHWGVYFAVADADAAVAKITDLGGSIIMPAEDTPYGRLAQAADPTGAVFKIVAG